MCNLVIFWGSCTGGSFMGEKLKTACLLRYLQNSKDNILNTYTHHLK